MSKPKKIFLFLIYPLITYLIIRIKGGLFYSGFDPFIEVFDALPDEVVVLTIMLLTLVLDISILIFFILLIKSCLKFGWRSQRTGELILAFSLVILAFALALYQTYPYYYTDALIDHESGLTDGFIPPSLREMILF